MNLFEKAIALIFGTKHERDAKRMRPIVDAINAREAELEALDDEAIRGRIEAIQQRVQSAITELPEDPRERSIMVQNILDPELEEVFALVREASKRTTGMRHFDVQMMGGVVLHEGRISEMRTGEGKTLVATLAVVLNALTGRGVHVVTVNDYLARPGGVRVGHYLRHQQRVRVRLSARQHEVRSRPNGAERPRFRHRRRGGLDSG
jgi:preprotein translocase subunit SecA